MHCCSKRLQSLCAATGKLVRATLILLFYNKNSRTVLRLEPAVSDRIAVLLRTSEYAPWLQKRGFTCFLPIFRVLPRTTVNEMLLRRLVMCMLFMLCV